nr:15907_t:CDS:2 [Entrophospora candida]CAG8449260.1 139_t:CDS:2 [Entrophospora candida]
MVKQLTDEDVTSNFELFEQNGFLLTHSLYWMTISILQIDLLCTVYVIYRTYKKWKSSNNGLSMAYRIPFYIAIIEIFIYVFQTTNLIHPAIFIENWPEPYCSIISGGFFFVTVTNIFMVGVIALMSWLVGIQQPNYGKFDYRLFIVPIGSAICSTIVARPTFRSDEFWCYTSDEFTTIPKLLLAIDFIVLVLTLFCYVSIIVRINSAELNNTNRSFLIASRKIVGYLTMYIIQWTPLMSYVIADILDQEYASVFFISINFIAFGGILNMIQYVINEGWVNENKSGPSSLSSSTELTVSNDNNIIIRVHVQNQNNDTIVADDLSSIDNKNK